METMKIFNWLIILFKRNTQNQQIQRLCNLVLISVFEKTKIKKNIYSQTIFWKIVIYRRLKTNDKKVDLEI